MATGVHVPVRRSPPADTPADVPAEGTEAAVHTAHPEALPAEGTAAGLRNSQEAARRTAVLDTATAAREDSSRPAAAVRMAVAGTAAGLDTALPAEEGPSGRTEAAADSAETAAGRMAADQAAAHLAGSSRPAAVDRTAVGGSWLWSCCWRSGEFAEKPHRRALSRALGGIRVI